ncbi:hypothetical protein [Xenorhabdus bovienii]|uniref:Bacteriophage protein n=1 Tax=Xenorhabdus bovienii str. kraussei Becker Underwood TaxID=1398204 RepID=A0A077PQ19_XENBV|nr:hypothetical protein [Xenorhabdus bovienii]CDH26410.1 conserved membrane hypothetical protein [Xenorhabdus bovienii str. kraussei Becker Underwood]
MATLVDTLLVALKLDMSGFANDANKAIRAFDDLSKKSDGASTSVVTMSDDMIGASNAIDDLTKMQEKLTIAVYGLTQKVDDASTAIVDQSDGMNEAADSAQDLDKSNQELAKSTEDVGKSSKETQHVVLSFSDSLGNASGSAQDMSKAINGAIKALAGLFTTIFVSTGLTKLISEVSQSNDQLHFLSKNLGMDATAIKKWQNVAEMSGGSADGMAATMTNLNKSLWDLVTMGDASILPFFNALGIGVVDSYGKIRNLDDILLDMADSLSAMERPQAYNIAKNMGLDEGTINTLLEGRDAIQKRLDAQKNLVISTKEELELNRQLREQNAVLSQQWERLKTIVANYLIPRLLKLSTMVSGFLDYLNKHRDTAITLFQGIATVIGITLIPVVARAALAMLALFAPLITGTGLILAFIAALWLLYDDYKGWKEGKDSFFDWDTMNKSLIWVLDKLDEFGKWFKDTTIGKWFTDANGDLDSFKLTLGGLALFLGGPWLAGVLTSLALAGLGLLRFFGLPGALLAGAIWAFSELKSKIDNFDWDSLAENTAKGSVKAVEAIITAKKLMNAGSASEQGQILLDSAKSLPEVKLITEAVKFGSNTLSNNTDKQGNVNWLGVGKNIISSVSRTFSAASSVEVPNQNKRIYTTLTGKHTKEGGSRSYRNNNPGNIIWGDYAKRMGAIGHDEKVAGHVMAIFPDEKTGRNAKRKLIFEGSKFKNLTLDKAIERYAPEFDENGKRINNTPQYIRNVLAAVSGKNKKMSEYNIEEQNRILEAMKNTEGWKEGKSTFIPKNPTLVPNMDAKASSQFLSQTNKIQSMPTTGATNIKVDMNGDVIVHSSAETIKGTVADGTEAIRTSLSQIIPTMN